MNAEQTVAAVKFDSLALQVAELWQEEVIAQCDSAAAVARADLARRESRKADKIAKEAEERASTLLYDAKALTRRHAEGKLEL